ncbi:unnamed protein product [Symbiodinium sp. CCMP2592]|nr:unnamed protein product [Symbiodinium sp. CCMP2592]
MSMFDDDLGQELHTEEAVKPKSSLKPRRGSRRQSRRVSQAGVDAAVAAAVGEKSEAPNDNIGKALSKITGQAKALKFAMDLAQKAMQQAEQLGLRRDWMQFARHMMPETKRTDVNCMLFSTDLRR